MAHEFIAFGNSAIKSDAIEHSTWEVNKDNPLLGRLVISTSAMAYALPFEHEDVEKAAKAVGLATFYDDWAGKVKEVEKAKHAVEARAAAVAAAEETAAKAHAEEVAKQEAKIAAELEKAEKAEKAHAKAEHAHK